MVKQHLIVVVAGILLALFLVSGPAAWADAQEDLSAGRAALAAGEPDKALPLLEAAAEALPLSVEAQLALGQCQLQLGEIDNAAGQFRKVLRLSPDHKLAKRLTEALTGRRGKFEQEMATARRLASVPAYRPAIGVLEALLKRPLDDKQRDTAKLLLAEYRLWNGEVDIALTSAVALIDQSEAPEVIGAANAIAALAVCQNPTIDTASRARFLDGAKNAPEPWKARVKLVEVVAALNPGALVIDDRTVAELSSGIGQSLESIPNGKFRSMVVARMTAACGVAANRALASGDSKTALAIAWSMVSNAPAPGIDAILKPVPLEGGWLGDDASAGASWLQVSEILVSIGREEVNRLGPRAQLLAVWLASETIRQSPLRSADKTTRTVSLLGQLASLSRPTPERKPGSPLSHADTMQHTLILSMLGDTETSQHRDGLVGAIVNLLGRYEKAGDLEAGLKLFEAQRKDGFASMLIGPAHARLLHHFASQYAMRGQAAFSKNAATLQADANAKVNADDRTALAIYGRIAGLYPNDQAASKQAAAIGNRYLGAEQWSAARDSIELYHAAIAAVTGDGDSGAQQAARRWALLRIAIAEAQNAEAGSIASRRKLPDALPEAIEGALTEAVAVLKAFPSKARQSAVTNIASGLVKRYNALQRRDLAEAVIATVVAAQGDDEIAEDIELRDWALWMRADQLETQAVSSLQRRAGEIESDNIELEVDHKAELELLGRIVTDYPDSPYAKAAAARVRTIASTYQRYKAHAVATKVLSDFIAAHPDTRLTEQLAFEVAKIAITRAQIAFAEREDPNAVPEALSAEHAAAIDALMAFLNKYPKGDYAAATENELLGIARTYGGANAWPVARQVIERMVEAMPDARHPKQLRFLEAATYLGELDRNHGLSLLQPPPTPRDLAPMEGGESTALALRTDGDDLDFLAGTIGGLDEVKDLEAPEEFGAPANETESRFGDRLSRARRPGGGQGGGGGQGPGIAPQPTPEPTAPQPNIRPPASDTALAMIRQSERQQLAQIAMLGNNRGVADQRRQGQQQQADGQSIALPGGVVLSEAAMKKQDAAADKAYAILLELLKSDQNTEPAVVHRARQEMFWMIGFIEGQLRHDRAIVMIERFLKDRPNDPDRIALAYRAVADQFTFAAARKADERINQKWVDERHARFETGRTAVAEFIKANADESDWVNKARLALFNSYLTEAELVTAVSNVRAGGLLVRAADELLAMLEELPHQPDVANYPNRMWQIADRLSSLGQRDQAIYILNRITVQFPTHPLARQALLRVAQTYASDLNSPLRAVEAYQEYIALVGNDEAARQQIFNIASSLAAKQRYIEALHVYEVFVDSFPYDGKADAALQAIGGIHQANEVWADAIKSYQRLIDEFPNSPQLPRVKFAVAECQIHLSEWQKARRLYDEYIKAHPKSNETAIAVSRIEVLKNLARFDKLLKDEQVKRNKDDAQFQTARIVLEQLKYPRKAIREFEKVVATYPGSHLADDAQLEVGKIYLSLNELDKAREELLKVAANHPTSSLADNALYLIGQSYEQQAARIMNVTASAARAEAYERGQRAAYQSAQFEQQQAKEKFSDENTALKKAGKSRELAFNEALGNLNISGRRVNKIMNDASSVAFQAEAESALEIANRQDKINEAYRNAVEMYARAAREYPLGDRTSESLLRMASIHETNLKDREAAKETYERVVKFFPGTPVAENAAWKVAQFHEQEGDYERAVAAYRDFIRNYPASGRVADAQFAMAESLEQLGRWVEAMDAYQTFREKFAKHANAPTALEQINWIKAYRR